MQAQILVPLDGSPGAEAIFTPLIPLADATRSGLTLVRAIPPAVGIDPVLGTPLPIQPPAEEQTQVHQDAARYLAAVAGRVARPGASVRTVVLEGAPSTAILDYVTHHPEVHAVAMATHGRQGLTRWIFGSVAEEILHQAPVPVLLLRRPGAARPAGAEAAMRTILVPLDGSPFAEAALDQARRLAQATGARLVLVTAVEGVDAASGATDEIPLWLQQRRQAELDRLALYLQDQAARLAAAGVPADGQIGDGRPADVIRAQSAEVHADLIVMATHGRTGFGRLRLGSTALAVVENTPIPVFLVRGLPSQPAPETRPRVATGVGGEPISAAEKEP